MEKFQTLAEFVEIAKTLPNCAWAESESEVKSDRRLGTLIAWFTDPLDKISCVRLSAEVVHIDGAARLLVDSPEAARLYDMIKEKMPKPSIIKL